MIRKVKFSSIPVRDQDRALNFYVNILGFILQTDQPMGPGAPLDRGSRPSQGQRRASLCSPHPALRTGSERSRGFLSKECDDVQKTFEELSGKGVEFAKPPKAESWGVGAVMIDSEGNQIVLSSAH